MHVERRRRVERPRLDGDRDLVAVGLGAREARHELRPRRVEVVELDGLRAELQPDGAAVRPHAQRRLDRVELHLHQPVVLGAVERRAETRHQQRRAQLHVRRVVLVGLLVVLGAAQLTRRERAGRVDAEQRVELRHVLLAQPARPRLYQTLVLARQHQRRRRRRCGGRRGGGGGCGCVAGVAALLFAAEPAGKHRRHQREAFERRRAALLARGGRRRRAAATAAAAAALGAAALGTAAQARLERAAGAEGAGRRSGRRARERAVVYDVVVLELLLERRQRRLPLRIGGQGEVDAVDGQVGAPLVAPPPQIRPAQPHARAALRLGHGARRVAPPGRGGAHRRQRGAAALAQLVAAALPRGQLAELPEREELRVADRDAELAHHLQAQQRARRLDRRDRLAARAAQPSQVELGAQREAQRLQDVVGRRRAAHHRQHQLVPPRRRDRRRRELGADVSGGRRHVQRHVVDGHALARERRGVARLDAAVDRCRRAALEPQRAQHHAAREAGALARRALNPNVHVGHRDLQLLQQQRGEALDHLVAHLLLLVGILLQRLPRRERLGLGARLRRRLLRLVVLAARRLRRAHQEDAVDADDQRVVAEHAPGHLDPHLAKRAAEYPHGNRQRVQRLRAELQAVQADVARPDRQVEALPVEAVHKGP